MESKRFSGSYAHIISMVYPWIVVLTVVVLHDFKLIDVLLIPKKYIIGIIVIPPVLLTLLWFFLQKNKNL
jgi:hypothetical protein